MQMTCLWNRYNGKWKQEAYYEIFSHIFEEKTRWFYVNLYFYYEKSCYVYNVTLLFKKVT